MEMAPAILHTIAVVLVLVCAITDTRTGRIYNKATLPGIAAGLALNAVFGGRTAFLGAVAGLLVGLVPFALAAARGWIGGGDAKLFAALGAILGVVPLLDIVLIAFVLAALWGLGIVVRQEGVRGAVRRFGAGMAVVLRGRQVDMDAAESGPTLRLGAFIFVATLVVVGGIWLTP